MQIIRASILIMILVFINCSHNNSPDLSKTKKSFVVRTFGKKDTINVIDGNGLKQGVWIERDSISGIKKKVLIYKNDSIIQNNGINALLMDEFKKYYDDYGVEGSFTLYDEKNDNFILYNQSEFKRGYSPASTFKICNSLIGLETGVIKDENFIIKWDGIKRPNEKWNSDHDLKMAYKNSTVWYYRELARRVGGKQMKFWLDKANYGNADTSGGVDLFWLKGGLRITRQQQIDFLKRLHDNKLPFSKRSMDIVKNIMIAKDTLGYVLRAKTGWNDAEPKSDGWYVGYVQTKDNVYYFANCIHTADFNKAPARIEITYKILEDLEIIKK